jgi:hypothetical protein
MRFFTFLAILFSVAFGQGYQLEVFVNNQSVPWQLVSGSLESKEATVTFEAGRLELNLADWNTFNYAHILATTFEKTAADTYTVTATMRHNDTGWDNYADAFEVKGDPVQNGMVQNGLRVLAHPHENEQPFARSQSNVVATGLVWVEARDNVEGSGGSKIYLDVSHSVFTDQDIIEVSYILQ